MGPRFSVSDLSAQLAPLWKELHRRFSTGYPVSRVRVGPLDEGQRAALADLLGLERSVGEYANVGVASLDLALKEGLGIDARGVVGELLGPITDRRAANHAKREEREQLWTWLAEHEVVAAQPALLDWTVAVERGGLFGGSVAETRAELERALDVLQQLPRTGIELAAFASDVVSNTHALDEGTRLQRLVLRGLAAIYAVDPPADAQAAREIWARAGVLTDELSSTVLAAGLPGLGRDVVGAILNECAGHGEAASLTLGQLRRVDRFAEVPSTVFVVENPTIIAMALRRFGTGCPPLVCTAGWPSGAGILLLRLLGDAGARLLYHGDLDGEGLRIAAHVLARVGAHPWRMNSADYLDSVSVGPPVGRLTPAPWDAELTEHMRRVGVSVSEEHVSELLLSDMR